MCGENSLFVITFWLNTWWKKGVHVVAVWNTSSNTRKHKTLIHEWHFFTSERKKKIEWYFHTVIPSPDQVRGFEYGLIRDCLMLVLHGKPLVDILSHVNETLHPSKRTKNKSPHA